MMASCTYNKGVKLVTVIQAQSGESQALLAMIQGFNEACNWLSALAFSEKLFRWLPLQRRAYHELRLRFGLTSAQAVVAVRKVAYAYRHKARRGKQARFRPLGAMPLYQHIYRDGTVRIYGLKMPCITRPGAALPGKPLQATLSFVQGKFLIHQAVEVEAPDSYQPQGFLGVDLGIKNIAADSQGQTYAGGHLNGLRHRHARLRARLQHKGTRSARRLLTKRRLRESRFARNVNHVISKALVDKARRHSLALALEDLRGIRGRLTVGRVHRRAMHSWAFQQLRAFIGYKAQLWGVPLVIVDPRNTSRTCPACGLIDKGNRKSQGWFLCVSCGFAGPADTVAAGNIARRAAGNQPHAPPPEMSKSLVPKGQSPTLSDDF